jgi:hypothetical protein
MRAEWTNTDLEQVEDAHLQPGISATMAYQQSVKDHAFCPRGRRQGAVIH